MACTATSIIQSIAQTLRAGGQFALVSIGAGSDSAVPQAIVELQGQDFLRPDDTAAARWVRLRISVTIRTRSQDTCEAIGRACDLCDLAIAALLVDPHRGGLCSDLPVGRATEIERVQLTDSLRRPEVEAAFIVRCHFEQEDA